ncbi:MAG: PDZ domain-containing protein [Aurantibacter sp.]
MNGIRTKWVFVLLALSSSLCLMSQKLQRRAAWESKISGPSKGLPGAIITSIAENSPLHKAGFLAGDIIIKVNGIHIADAEIWSNVTYGLRAQKPMVIEAVRKHESITANVSFMPLEKEIHDKIETY